MLKHFFLTSLRLLWHQKRYAFISMLSLAVGLSVFFLSLLYVKHEFSYNRGWEDSGQTYRVIRKQSSGRNAFGSGSGMDETEVLRLTTYVEDLVSDFVHVSPLATTIRSESLESVTGVGITAYLTETSFAGIFNPEVTAGNLSFLWDSPDQIALERSVATAIFGSVEAAINSQVTLAGREVAQQDPFYMSGSDRDFQVVAVYELPGQVTAATRFDALVPMQDYAYQLLPSRRGYPEITSNLWLKLLPGISPGFVEEQLADFASREINSRQEQEVLNINWEYLLEALTDIYFNPDTTDSLGEATGDISRVYTFLLAGALVLFVACSNSVSLGLVSANERQRETGIRKSMGATAGNIVVQYQFESLLLTGLVLVPVLLLIHFYHPVFYQMFDITNMTAPGVRDYLMLAAIALTVALVNGIYPSLVLSRLKPVTVLKPHAVQPSGRIISFRALLVTVQFVFAILLLIIAFGLLLQLRYAMNRPMGFNPENLAQVYLDSPEVRSLYLPALLNELDSTAGIIQAEAVSAGPNSGSSTNTVVEIRSTPDPTDGVQALLSFFSAEQFTLTEIGLLGGEPFSIAQPDSDNPAENTPVVLNRSAVTAMGFADPEAAIGKEVFLDNQILNDAALRKVIVTAVVENSVYHNMTGNPEPTIYMMSSSRNYIMFRYQEDFEDRVLDVVATIWQRVTGADPIDMLFIDEYTRQVYADEINQSRLLLLCAAMTLFLAASGLYGLVSVNIKARARDIAVHKVLGATRQHIIWLFLRNYSIPVLAAMLVASPLGIYTVMQWIEQFSWQMDKIWLLPLCLVTGITVLFVALGTILQMTLAAASEKPVVSLRYD